MNSLPYLEVVEKLRVVACATCGETYAVPLALLLAAKRDQKLIYCPAGHPWRPLSDDADRQSNDHQARIELGAALADTRLKLDAARACLLELAPSDSAAPDKAELRRRPGLTSIEDIRAMLAARQIRITPDGERYLLALANEFGAGALRQVSKLLELAVKLARGEVLTADLLRGIQARRLGLKAAESLEASMAMRMAKAVSA